VPTLRRILEGPHPVVATVSQPDRRRGRGRQTSPSPVSATALEAGLPLLRPEKVGAPECVGALRAHAPDLGVVVAFGQFIPKSVRTLPAEGYLINGHASLLPRHRGAAPIAHAILAGDSETGISVMRVEREMDAGPVAGTARIPIGADENTGALTERLARLCADSIAEVLDEIADGSVRFAPQDHDRATLAPKLGRADAELDFTRPAVELARRVRAMAPRPGAFTTLEQETIRVLAAHTEPGPTASPPGTVQLDGAGGLRVATGDGWLLPLSLQRAGKQPMATEAFLRGRAIAVGSVLGSPQ